ncbi:MAG: type II toxin-antitoxin system RelE/ParE family toxin [Acidobacteria bacterium]|nr:type II toxin-antitoxin system RelE/ParE family toxin [Acidobacteriota bacterium]
MKPRLRIGREARRDIRYAAVWYETERAGLGFRFLCEIDRLLERIVAGPAQFPQIGRRARRGLIRRFPFAVYFTTSETEVIVRAVLHMRRHPDTWKREDEPRGSR